MKGNAATGSHDSRWHHRATITGPKLGGKGIRTIKNPEDIVVGLSTKRSKIHRNRLRTGNTNGKGVVFVMIIMAGKRPFPTSEQSSFAIINSKVTHIVHRLGKPGKSNKDDQQTSEEKMLHGNEFSWLRKTNILYKYQDG